MDLFGILALIALGYALLNIGTIIDAIGVFFWLFVICTIMYFVRPTPEG